MAATSQAHLITTVLTDATIGSTAIRYQNEN
jgi:hypothetical protein